MMGCDVPRLLGVLVFSRDKMLDWINASRNPALSCSPGLRLFLRCYTALGEELGPGHMSRHCPASITELFRWGRFFQITCTAHALARFQPMPSSTCPTASRHGPRTARGRDRPSQHKAWMWLHEQQWGWESRWVIESQNHLVRRDL